MIKIKFDNKEYSVTEGLSVLAAARLKGIEIPSICYREGKPHFTSCMICMVKDRESGKLFPSCSLKVREGMDVITDDEEIKDSRRTALELMLSEHTGDCMAPCQVTCPAHMDIPGMNRLLAEGAFEKALSLVKQTIPLPSVFGRICPAPCEGACRRKSVDDPVSICLLKRYAGDHEIRNGNPSFPAKAPDTGKKIAIIGAGPSGLAAAYYLQLFGHQCDIYDRRNQPGGSLWEEVEIGTLPKEVLEYETAFIRKLGAWFYPSTEVDAGNFRKLEGTFDAVLVAAGTAPENESVFGLPMTDKGIDADRQTYQVGKGKIFATGSAVRPSKMAIRALGQGREAAVSIDQYLSGLALTGESTGFNSRFGALQPEEVDEYLKESLPGKRIEPTLISEGFSREEVMKEAARCIHCDCRALDDCKLRDLSEQYHASQKRFWSEDRRQVQKFVQHSLLVYEPNKCVKCGICVRIAEEHKEKFGLSFIGRGFDVTIGVPFNEALEMGLEEVAEQVIEECPTGALASK